MKQIPPLILKNDYWEPLRKEISKILRALIFDPLIKILLAKNPEYLNSSDSLASAIQDGSVWYEDGHFRGEFNAAISKSLRALGAMYNPKSRTWSLEASFLPPQLRTAQAHADSRYDALRRGFLTTLADVDIDSIDNIIQTSEQYKKTIDWMNSDFEKSLKAITIAPKLTTTQRDIIATEWGQNLNLYIKDWTAKSIIELRGKIQNEAFTGRRAESLERMIRDSYGVSQRKAEFLARQETSLLMSKFRETRYGEIGVNKYRWSTSHDERVRSDHRHLNGKVFRFDSPPVSNLKTGARNNPGEDFGCRCIAVALVD